jgi:hypothetical protein
MNDSTEPSFMYVYLSVRFYEVRTGSSLPHNDHNIVLRLSGIALNPRVVLNRHLLKKFACCISISARYDGELEGPSFDSLPLTVRPSWQIFISIDRSSTLWTRLSWHYPNGRTIFEALWTFAGWNRHRIWGKVARKG